MRLHIFKKMSLIILYYLKQLSHYLFRSVRVNNHTILHEHTTLHVRGQDIPTKSRPKLGVMLICVYPCFALLQVKLAAMAREVSRVLLASRSLPIHVKVCLYMSTCIRTYTCTICMYMYLYLYMYTYTPKGIEGPIGILDYIYMSICTYIYI